jgi:hypothetical protein
LLVYPAFHLPALLAADEDHPFLEVGWNITRRLSGLSHCLTYALPLLLDLGLPRGLPGLGWSILDILNELQEPRDFLFFCEFLAGDQVFEVVLIGKPAGNVLLEGIAGPVDGRASLDAVRVRGLLIAAVDSLESEQFAGLLVDALPLDVSPQFVQLGLGEPALGVQVQQVQQAQSEGPAQLPCVVHRIHPLLAVTPSSRKLLPVRQHFDRVRMEYLLLGGLGPTCEDPPRTQL